MADDAKLKVRIEIDDRDARKKIKDLKKGETVKIKAGAPDSKGGSVNPIDAIKKAFAGMKGAISGGAGAGAGGQVEQLLEEQQQVLLVEQFLVFLE